jgi:hypothetical protein
MSEIEIVMGLILTIFGIRVSNKAICDTNPVQGMKLSLFEKLNKHSSACKGKKKFIPMYNIRK